MRKFGTRFFYDTNQGYIIHIDHDIKGTGIKPTRLNKKEVSELYQVPLDSIGIKDIPYGEFTKLNSSDTRNIIAIDSFGNFVRTDFYGRYNINYNDQEVKHEYTKDEILRYYNKDYLFNISQSLKIPDINYKFLDIDDLNIREEALDIAWYNYFDDDYVVESFSDRSIIAKDIVENGMFWPIIAEPIPGKERYSVIEGNHRVISSKILKEEGQWSDKKLLTLVSDFIFKDKAKVVNLPRKIRGRAPYISKYYDLGYPNPGNEQRIKETFKQRNTIYVDDKKEIIEYDIYTYFELYNTLQVFPKWLRDLFFSLKEKEGFIVQGLNIINDEEEFRKLVKNNV